MQLDVRTRGLPHPDWYRGHARRRLGLALGRFADRIAQVDVALEDVNGPRGGVDKRCTLRALLRRGGPPLVVRNLDRHLSVAIDLAADRLARSVVRAIERRRSRRRSSPDARSA